MFYGYRRDPKSEEPVYARYAAVRGSAYAQSILAHNYALGEKVEKNMQMAACMYFSSRAMLALNPEVKHEDLVAGKVGAFISL